MHRTAADQGRIRRPKGRSEYRADTTEAALAEMRQRLAHAEQALAQCSDEAAETAGELAAARDELHRASAARDEAEKISAGLKQHIALLMADVKEWHAAFAAMQQARLAEKAEADRTIAALAREVKQVLAALDSSRLDLAARLGDVESAHARQAAQLEIRLSRQAEEIEMLLQVVENKQHEAEHERIEAERLRRAAAGAVGRAAGLLDGRTTSSVWKPLRLRRQAAALRNSGIFDADWYLRQYADVANAGIDPLRHYVEFGAKEGRVPNPALAPPPGKPEAKVQAGLAPKETATGAVQGRMHRPRSCGPA